MAIRTGIAPDWWLDHPRELATACQLLLDNSEETEEPEDE